MAVETTEKRQNGPRRSKYHHYAVRLHIESAVHEAELLGALQSLANAAGETLTASMNRRSKTFVMAPKGLGRPSAQERAKKRLQDAIDAAVKAGLDPRDVLP